MSDFLQQRNSMVDGQIRPNGVTDPRITDRMRAVPREFFVPKQKQAIAYMDEVIEIAPGRFAMEPMFLAKLIQALDVEPTDSVLIIGAGLGYSAAVLGGLCDTVIGLEEDEALAQAASDGLPERGVDNAAIVTGPLVDGFASQAPYDVIMIDGAYETVPDSLLEQLAEDGRLGGIRVDGRSGQAEIYVKSDGVVSKRVAFDAVVPVLPGFDAPRSFVL